MSIIMRPALTCAMWVCMLTATQACDICGCSISNNNPFLFPNASRHFLGLSWYHRSYNIHTDDGSNANLNSHSLLLTGQYGIGSRWRLQAVIPYISNQYTDGTRSLTKQGMGDISLVAAYNMLNRYFWGARHLLTLTAGVKLNTASATPAQIGIPDVMDLQTGSGSTDYIVAANYRYTKDAWIAQLQTGYRYNTPDKTSGLRFGDTWTNSLNVYRKFASPAFTVTPYLNGVIETHMDDARNHKLISYSGGSASFLGAGIDLNTRKLALGINCQFKVNESIAAGTISEQARLNAHLFFTL